MPAEYVYHPLASSEDTIRLLDVRVIPVWDEALPNYRNDDPQVVVTVKEVRADEVVDQYDTVSYVWGEDESSHPILLNGCHHLVRNNVWRFLMHYSTKVRDQSCLLWIDCISIDQSVTEEKNRQVQMMGQIFMNSRRTLIWLGEDSEESDLASLCSDYVDDDANIDGTLMHTALGLYKRSEDDLFRSLTSIFDTVYWKRLWVVQEVILTTTPVIIYGPYLLGCIHARALVEQRGKFFKDYTNSSDVFEWASPSKRPKRRIGKNTVAPMSRSTRQDLRHTQSNWNVTDCGLWRVLALLLQEARPYDPPHIVGLLGKALHVTLTQCCYAAGDSSTARSSVKLTRAPDRYEADILRNLPCPLQHSLTHKITGYDERDIEIEFGLSSDVSGDVRIIEAVSTVTGVFRWSITADELSMNYKNSRREQHRALLSLLDLAGKQFTQILGQLRGWNTSSDEARMEIMMAVHQIEANKIWMRDQYFVHQAEDGFVHIDISGRERKLVTPGCFRRFSKRSELGVVLLQTLHVNFHCSSNLQEWKGELTEPEDISWAGYQP